MADALHQLEGVDWRLVALRDEGGALAALPDGVTVSARFEDGRVAGTSGCNRYTAGYLVTGEALEIAPAAGTMMACEEPAMRVEAAYLAGLGSVTTARQDGTDLLLADADGGVLFRFQPSAVTLVDTHWVAVGVNNGRGSVSSLVPGTEIDATFTADGRVTGTAGCNRYVGTWAQEGAELRIANPASTRRLCPEPDGVMAQEAAFLAALERVASCRLDMDRLEVRDAEGALQVAFAAGA